MGKLGRRLVVVTVAVLALIVIVISVISRVEMYSPMPSVTTEHEQLQPSFEARRANICEINHYDIEKTAIGRGFRNFTPPTLLDGYKNPCFLRKPSTTSRSKATKDEPGELQCLPYFFIAGFQKSATSDLWHRLLKHPDIIANHKKEPWIIHKHRHYLPFMSLGYTDSDKIINFCVNDDGVKSKRLQTCTFCNRRLSGSRLFAAQSKKVSTISSGTGEGSVDTAYCIFHWQTWPGNENCSEPVITNADYVHQLNPNMKIIFMIRSPPERLYSDYIFEAPMFRYKPSPEDFHSSILDAIESFDRCVKQHSVRFCAYNDLLDTNKIRIRIGMFHIFIDDWMKVFGPDQIIIANADSTLHKKRLDTYREILKFLDIRPFTQEEQYDILEGSLVNARSKYGLQTGDMLDETRNVLNEFYAPFNKQLSKYTIY